MFIHYRFPPCTARFAAMLAVSAAAASPSAAQPTRVWTLQHVSGPSPRAFHAMAYDSARAVSVLFGGVVAGGVSAETWEWDGSAWTQRQVTGPPARGYHAMAYDTARHVTVLFGGLSQSTAPLGDTWEWDGAAWAQRTGLATSPSARSSAAMAFDSARSRTVLFGGSVTGQLATGETWEWDGSAWTSFPATITRPSTRSGHVMAFDTSRARTMLYGGYTPGWGDDTWEWDGAAWTWRSGSNSSTSGRNFAAMVFNGASNLCLRMGGGQSSGTFGAWVAADVREWDGAAWAYRNQIVFPTYRWGHKMVYDSARNLVVLFGGTNTQMSPLLGDTWVFGHGCRTDFDQNGQIQPADIAAFVGAWFTDLNNGSVIVDFDGDGRIQPADIGLFVGVWFAELTSGC